MKSNRFKTRIILSTLVAISLFPLQAQIPAFVMTCPEGHGEGTTGGGIPTLTNTITVSTASALKSALTGQKSVILVSDTISTSRMDVIVTNKTIIGLPGATLINNDRTGGGSGILYLKAGSKNVIIRNLSFQGAGAYDADGWDLLTNKGCTKLWVDHCDFKDGVDDCFDNSNSADSITVSWCKFSYLIPPLAGGSGGSADHRFANLVGGSDTDSPIDNHYSITWKNCWWADGVVDRMVRARNAELHFINCYWNSKDTKHCISLTGGNKGTTCYVEGGVFACPGIPAGLDGTQSMSIKFEDCTKNGVLVTTPTLGGGARNSTNVTKPAYKYTVSPSNQVVDAVTNTTYGAGATLQVSNEGFVSTSIELNTINTKNSSMIDCYTWMNDHSLNVVFPNIKIGKTAINIYDICGKCIFSSSRTICAQEPIEVDLQGFDSGTYILCFQNENVKLIRKIVMK
jgi:pectate lyase